MILYLWSYWSNGVVELWIRTQLSFPITPILYHSSAPYLFDSLQHVIYLLVFFYNQALITPTSQVP